MLFKHPSLFVFTFTLFVSVILVVSTTNWFLVWLGLEINLFVFIPLIVVKESKYLTESGVKYFMTQAMASIIILMSMFTMKNSSQLSCFMLMLALSLKMGAAPLHQWMISIVPSLSWGSMLMLMGPQKVPPVLLMTLFAQNTNLYLMLFIIIVSSLVGSLGGFMSFSLKKIMAYSSIAHLSWMLTSVLLNKYLWLIYFSLYFMTLITLFNSFNKMHFKTLTDMFLYKKGESKLPTSLNMASLMGLPPFTGFLMKMSVITFLVKSDISFLTLPLLMSSILSLYFYLQITVSNLFLTSSKIYFYFKKLLSNPYVVTLNFMGLILAYPLLMM